MAVSRSEHISGTRPVVGDEVTQDIDPQCALCLDRAFGIVALGAGAPTGTLSDALETIQAAEETWTYNARTRATIYRCKADACGHAILSFTVAGAPTVPDPSNLHLEQLPGAQDCGLPPEAAVSPPEV